MAIDLKAVTTKKVYGIPVLYIVAVIALVALYGAIRLPKKTDTPDTSTDVAPEDSTGGDYAGPVQQPVFVSNATAPVSAGVVDTNEAWSRRAIEWLTANGASLTDATGAITKYLSGDAPSQAEADLRDKAVKQFGLPPEAIIPITPVAVPEPAPAAETPYAEPPADPGYQGPASRQGVPPLVHTVTGQSDNQWIELTNLYWGRTGEPAIRLLIAANPNLKKPFPKGTRVHIPAFHEPVFYKATTATRTVHAIAQKNGTTAVRIQMLNPGTGFPVRAGTRVRVA